MISSDSACHFLEKTMTVNSRNLGVGLLLYQFVICVLRNFGECIWFGVVAGGSGYTAVLSLITPFESKL
jgi:hypothetical protein